MISLSFAVIPGPALSRSSASKFKRPAFVGTQYLTCDFRVNVDPLLQGFLTTACFAMFVLFDSSTNFTDHSPALVLLPLLMFKSLTSFPASAVMAITHALIHVLGHNHETITRDCDASFCD